MLAVVIEAVLRVGRRALKSKLAVVIAAAAFVALFFFAVPFPLVVAAAAIIGFAADHLGYAMGGHAVQGRDDDLLGENIPDHARPSLALLREIASRGIWVSTHPDVTQKMDVKEVLYTTRHLGWGTDTRLYRTFDALREEFRGASRPTGHASSSKTAAMAARGYGRSSKRPSKRAMPSCWKHGGAVSRGLYPSLNSS